MDTAQDKKFAACYEKLREVMQIDYELAADVFKCVKNFVSENMDTDIEIDSVATLPKNANFGASVKVDGKIAFIVGILAEKKIFHEIAEHYEHFETESLEEDFDAVSELLNVVTGYLIVKIAETFGIEEDLEPPRYGKTEKTFDTIKMTINVGTFYLYIGKEEIF